MSVKPIKTRQYNLCRGALIRLIRRYPKNIQDRLTAPNTENATASPLAKSGLSGRNAALCLCIIQNTYNHIAVKYKNPWMDPLCDLQKCSIPLIPGRSIRNPSDFKYLLSLPLTSQRYNIIIRLFPPTNYSAQKELDYSELINRSVLLISERANTAFSWVRDRNGSFLPSWMSSIAENSWQKLQCIARPSGNPKPIQDQPLKIEQKQKFPFRFNGRFCYRILLPLVL